MEFCESAKAWLDINEENVVSLHCKAGKGRAGLMAACLMVRLGQTAEAAVMKFDAVGYQDLNAVSCCFCLLRVRSKLVSCLPGVAYWYIAGRKALPWRTGTGIFRAGRCWQRLQHA